jgi:hypothetical protein
MAVSYKNREFILLFYEIDPFGFIFQHPRKQKKINKKLITNCLKNISTNMRCAQDGAAFDGEPVLLPVDRDPVTRVFTFANLCFCSVACAKGYLFRDAHSRTDHIHLFHIYVAEVLGLTKEQVQVSPDPMFLRDFMLDPSKGLTLEQFRGSSSSSGTVVGTRLPGVDPTLDESIQYSFVKLNRLQTEEIL